METKIWISRYALSKGIFEAQADIDGSMAVIRKPYHTVYFGNDWWLTRAEAVADAEQRRQAKMKSLSRQIAKMQKLRFHV